MAWCQVILTVFNVLGVILTQALPSDSVENEGAGFEENGDADVKVAVRDVVVKHAGSLCAAHRAPQ